MNLYSRIKLRREELGMSQEELATKLGYKSRSTINKIETGTNDIPQSKIQAFADALKTTPAYLMGWVDSKEIIKQNLDLVISENEKKLLSNYNKLNDIGRNKLLEYSEDLSGNMNYTSQNELSNSIDDDYLMPIAAHNDNITDEEIELINQDLADMDNW